MISSRHNHHVRQLPALHVNHQVQIQETPSGLWDKVGTVVLLGKSWQFHVWLPSGRFLWRNRRHLLPAVFAAGQPEGPLSADDGPNIHRLSVDHPAFMITPMILQGKDFAVSS